MQYEYWEYGVRNWFTEWQKSHPDFKETTATAIPTATDDVHMPDKAPKIGFIAPTENGVIDPNSRMSIELSSSGAYPPEKTEVYLNNKYVLTAESNPLNISFVPADISSLSASNTLSVVVYDKVFNKGEASVNFAVAASGI